jgi:predicted nucleic acid-binding protein
MEVNVALDTIRLTDLLRGDHLHAKQLSSCDRVYVPVIVFAELLAGVYGGSRQPENESHLRRFLAKLNVALLAPSRESFEHYARLFQKIPQLLLA